MAPAAPPLARFPRKNLSLSSLGVHRTKIFLYLSLKAKFSAWVGKYRITLAVFPLLVDAINHARWEKYHKLKKPCSFGSRRKVSIMPL